MNFKHKAIWNEEDDWKFKVSFLFEIHLIKTHYALCWGFSAFEYALLKGSAGYFKYFENHINYEQQK